MDCATFTDEKINDLVNCLPSQLLGVESKTLKCFPNCSPRSLAILGLDPHFIFQACLESDAVYEKFKISKSAIPRKKRSQNSTKGQAPSRSRFQRRILGSLYRPEPSEDHSISESTEQFNSLTQSSQQVDELAQPVQPPPQCFQYLCSLSKGLVRVLDDNAVSLSLLWNACNIDGACFQEHSNQ